MKKSTPGDDWPPLPPRPRPGHRFHMASIAMPFLGLSLAIGFLSLTPSFGGLNHWPTNSKAELKQTSQALWLLGIAGLVGLFSAGVSIARKEVPGYLAALGLLLNGPLVLLWLLTVGEMVIEWSGVR
jgi:hypothetical protein